MSTLNISAGHQYSSHSGTTVVDISGASSNIESFKAPFDCKLIQILKVYAIIVVNIGESNDKNIF